MAKLSGAIQSEGALVNVEISHSEFQVRDLRRAGSPIQQPISLRALVDTGSDVSCVDGKSILGLALPVKGITPTNVPALGGLIGALQREASLRIVHPSGDASQDLIIADQELADIALGELGYQCLLGRDFLKKCRFVYDGKTDQFELVW